MQNNNIIVGVIIMVDYPAYDIAGPSARSWYDKAIGYLHPFLGKFIPGAGTINSLYCASKILPPLLTLLPELANLTRSPSDNMKKLKKLLEAFNKAIDKNNFELLQQLAPYINEAIGTAFDDPENSFKAKSSNQTPLEDYVQPLSHLQGALDTFQRGSLVGCDHIQLKTLVEKAQSFINHEVEAQTGAIEKKAKATVKKVKKVFEDEFVELEELKPVKLTPLPLDKLTSDLARFRFNKNGFPKNAIHDILARDLKAFADSDDRFKGAYAYVMNHLNGKKLVDAIDTLLFDFIIDVIDKDEAIFDAELYGSILMKQAEHFCIEKELDEHLKEKTPEGISTLLTTIMQLLEIEKFDGTMNRLEKGQGLLIEKIDQAIDVLRTQLYISKAPKFKERFGALVKHYIYATYNRFKNEDISEAFAAYKNGRYGAALLRLKRTHGVTGEGSTELEKTLDIVTAYGEKFLPQKAMEKLKEIFEIFKAKAVPFFGHKAKGKKILPTPPLKQIWERIKEGGNHLVVQNNLKIDVERLKIAYPEFRELEIDCEKSEDVIDQIVIFISGSVRQKLDEDKLALALYHVAVEYGEVGADAQTEEAGQIAWGKTFLDKDEDQDQESQNTIPIFFYAVTHLLEMKKLEKTINAFTKGNPQTLLEVSQNVDIALTLLEQISYLEGATELLQAIYLAVHGLIDMTYEFIENNEEAQEVEGKINEATALSKAGDPVAALKILKELFESGPVARKTLAVEETASSAVANLARDFAEKTQPVEEVPSEQIVPDKKLTEEVTKNLTEFATVQALGKFLGWNPEKINKEHYQLYQSIKDKDYEERKQAFVKGLDQWVNDSNLGFFAKATGHMMITVVRKLMRIFALRIVDVVAAELQSLMLKPTNDFLNNAHLKPASLLNEAVLRYLRAHRQWKEGDSLAGKSKVIQQNIYEEGKNGGVDASELYQRIIKEGIKIVLDNISIREKAANWRKNLSHSVGKSRTLTGRVFRTVGSGLGKTATYLGLPVLILVDWTQFLALKGSSSLALQLFNFGELALHSVSDVVKGPVLLHKLNTVILEQLKKLEASMGREGGDAVERYETKAEKQLFGEVARNIVQLINEKPELLQDQKDQESNIVAYILRKIKGLRDEQLTSVAYDVISLIHEILKDKKEMNTLVNESLQGMANAFLPTEHGSLEDAYSKEEIEKLDKCDTERFERDLQQKFAETEKEIRDTIARICSKKVNIVINDKFGSLLTPANKAVLKQVKFIENQLIPQRALTQTREATYIAKMEKLIEEQNFDGLKAKHRKFLSQLRANTALLKARKEGARCGTQILNLYEITKRLSPHISLLSGAIADENYEEAQKALAELQKAAEKELFLLDSIRNAIESQKQSLGDHAAALKQRLVRWGADGGAPLLKAGVEFIINGAFNEVLNLKDGNVFNALVLTAVRNFANREKKPLQQNRLLLQSPDSIVEDFRSGIVT